MGLNTLEIELKEQKDDARCSYCSNGLIFENTNAETGDGKAVPFIPPEVVPLEKTYDAKHEQDAVGVLCGDCSNANKKGYPREILYAIRVVEEGGKKIVERVAVKGLYDKPKPKPVKAVDKLVEKVVGKPTK